MDIRAWGLQRLAEVCTRFNYVDIDLDGCTSTDIEHLHSTCHSKFVLLSKLQFARFFGQTMKESLKRLSLWSVHYHTSRKSWYPKPGNSIDLYNIPVMEVIPEQKMEKTNIEAMRDWAKSFGRGVRQRTNRQETTMARHGALPEYIWQRKLKISDRIEFDHETDTILEVAGGVKNANDNIELVEDACAQNDDIQSEYDSDDESDSDSVNESEYDSDERDCDNATNEGEINVSDALTRETLFLVGRTSRSGRLIRFNSHYLR